MHKDIIDSITISILHDPRNVPASQYITAYNAIYYLCTDDQPFYEIKGQEVYKYLASVVNDFTNKLKPFESIDEISMILSNYDKSIDHIQVVFSYLERYFIRVCIDRRDKEVMDIRTLLYTSIYENYLERRENQIFDLIISKLEFIDDKIRTHRLKKLILQTKNILIANDKGLNFKNFIKKYFNFFAIKIRAEPCLRNQCNLLQSRIKITSKLFEPYYFVSIQRNFIKLVSKKREEILRLIVEEMEMNKNVKFLFIIIETLEMKEQFYKEYSQFVSTMFPVWTDKNIDSVIDMYIHLKDIISRDFNKDNALIEILNQSCSKNNLNELSLVFIKRLNTCILALYDIKRILAIIDLINIMEYCQSNEDRLINDMEDRLIFFDSDLETLISDSIDKKKYQNLYSKIKRCIRDAKQINHVFKLKDCAEQPLDIKFRMLTNGFWDIQTQSTRENKDINLLRIQILEFCESHLTDKLKDKIVTFNYDISPIVIEINGCTIKLSTTAYLILDCIINADKININALNEHFTQSCEKYLQILCIKGIVSVDKNGFYSACKTIMESEIDIFDTHIKKIIEKKPVTNQIVNQLYSIEASIIRILKKIRQCETDDLFSMIGDDKCLYEQALNSLEKKDFIKRLDSIVCYMP